MLCYVCVCIVCNTLYVSVAFRSVTTSECGPHRIAMISCFAVLCFALLCFALLPAGCPDISCFPLLHFISIKALPFLQQMDFISSDLCDSVPHHHCCRMYQRAVAHAHQEYLSFFQELHNQQQHIKTSHRHGWMWALEAALSVLFCLLSTCKLNGHLFSTTKTQHDGMTTE